MPSKRSRDQSVEEVQVEVEAPIPKRVRNLTFAYFHVKAKVATFLLNDERNRNLRPDQVSWGSAKKFWFQCEACLHEFDASPNSVTSNRSWCPYCAGNKNCLKDRQESATKEACKDCWERSFASFSVETKVDAFLLNDKRNGSLRPHQVSLAATKSSGSSARPARRSLMLR